MLDSKQLAQCEIRISGIGGAATVLITKRPLEALAANLMRPGRVAVVLDHEAGVYWPDAAGLALMASALEAGEAVALNFVGLAAAFRAEARLHQLAEAAR